MLREAKQEVRISVTDRSKKAAMILVFIFKDILVLITVFGIDYFTNITPVFSRCKNLQVYAANFTIDLNTGESINFTPQFSY